MINSRTSGTFGFDGNNHLVQTASGGTGSTYYESRLLQAIASPNSISLKIPSTEAGKKILDDHFGGGVTTYQGTNATVEVSGNSTSRYVDTNGAPLRNTGADSAVHEMVGHAIPHTVGSDTGNAVENENKVRAQNGGALRQAEPSHREKG